MVLDYKQAKIYKIIDNTNNNVYIGSTCKTLKERLSKHQSDFKSYSNGKYHYVYSFKILQNNDYEIQLIELYPCGSKQELIKREGYHIKSLECVNKCVAGRTNAEYRMDNKKETSKASKKYYETNKNEISEYKKRKMNCICGSTITINHKTQHEQTKKHISFLKTQQVAIN